MLQELRSSSGGRGAFVIGDPLLVLGLILSGQNVFVDVSVTFEEVAEEHTVQVEVLLRRGG